MSVIKGMGGIIKEMGRVVMVLILLTTAAFFTAGTYFKFQQQVTPITVKVVECYQNNEYYCDFLTEKRTYKTLKLDRQNWINMRKAEGDTIQQIFAPSDTEVIVGIVSSIFLWLIGLYCAWAVVRAWFRPKYDNFPR